MREIIVVTMSMAIATLGLFYGKMNQSYQNVKHRVNHEIKENLSATYDANIVPLDVSTFTILGNTYHIEEELIPFEQLKEPIGNISKMLITDENNQILTKDELKQLKASNDTSQSRKIYNFGLIYRIVDQENDDTIAVEVNKAYHIANKVS